MLRLATLCVLGFSVLTACPPTPSEECTAAADCNDADACTTDACNAGACAHTAVVAGDGDACTVDACDPLVGVTHVAVTTDDANACTVDACDPAVGVTHVAVVLDDSDPCTVDACAAATGVTHTPVAVDDADACTADACDSSGNVTHVAIDVDDANACTTDTCDSTTGNVTHVAVATDDQDACTADACDPVTGVSHNAVVIDDSNACTTDACNSTTGAITHVAVSVDDSNACTTDACNTSTGAVTHVAVAIDDSNACTTDACNTGTGAITHVAVTIDDSNACTTDACDTGTGAITHTPVAVNDFDACTTDSCDSFTGFPTHVPVNVDDNNACTTDSCSAMAGVSHVAVSIDDSNACTTDSCDPSTGVAHTAVVIDDSNACTTDACAPSTGNVTHVAVNTDDADACTTDSCDINTGVAHVPVNVNDNNACTTDTCAPATGNVTHVAVDIDDTNACTTDSCDPTTGVAHVPVNVNDNDACTTDACASATGNITHTPVNLDDNDACTTDACSPSTGVSHVAVSIDDSIACTTDACTPAGGVTHTPVHSTCEVDGFTCTVAVCSTTTGCSETPSAVLCDDSVACTTDSCVGAGGAATTGCRVTPRDLSCSAVETCSATGCAAAVAGAQLGNIVITEFRALGVEFVELYNPGTAAIDVRGFTLRNAADQRATIRDVGDRAAGVGTPVTLAPGAYAWGVANPAGAIVGSPHFVFGDQGTPFTFADSGDQLLVYDRTGRLEDAIDFRTLHTNPGVAMTAASWPAFAGRSTQLGVTALTAIGNDASSAWCVTFYSAALRQRTDATAGTANTRCDTFVINEVLVDPSGSDDTKAFIELAGPGGAVVGGVKINDIEGIGTSAGQTNAAEYVVPAGTRMPVDGILLIADADSGGTTTLVPNFIPGVDVLAVDVDFENSGGDAIQLSSPANVLLDVLGHESSGAALAVATAVNGLATYETATALTTPSDTTLARSPLSDDTNDNRTDFHGDPSPTPGLPNDTVNFSLTSVTPTSGIVNSGTLSVVLQGTDLGSGTVFSFGATNATSCSVTNPSRMTCTLSSTTATVGAVNVTATPHLSVGGPASILTNGFTWTSMLNETDTAPEADFVNLQFPATATLQSGNSVLVYGRIFEAGVTEAAGPNASVRAELGIGPATATSFQGWTWVPATFNVQMGNDDEYQASLVAPTVTAPTNFSYTMRFSFDGLNWTYADLNGAGSNAGLALEFGQLGALSATP